MAQWPLGPRVELRSTLSAVRTIVHSLRAHPHTYLKRCALVRMCPSPSRSRVRAKVRSSPSQETSRTSQYLYLPIVYLRAGARATGDCPGASRSDESACTHSSVRVTPRKRASITNNGRKPPPPPGPSARLVVLSTGVSISSQTGHSESVPSPRPVEVTCGHIVTDESISMMTNLVVAVRLPPAPRAPHVSAPVDVAIKSYSTEHRRDNVATADMLAEPQH